MNTTEAYYEAVNNYRSALAEVWKKYEEDMEKIESYKGSTGYETDAQELTAIRDTEIENLQHEYRHKFKAILDTMVASATSKTLVAPSAEDLAILQALQMRERISRHELRQAANTLKDNKLALSVLSEISEKQGYHALPLGLSTDSVMDAVEGLTESAKRLCALSKPNSRKEQAAKASPYHPEHTAGTADLYSFRIDKDFKTQKECIAYMSGLSESDIKEFAEVVG